MKGTRLTEGLLKLIKDYQLHVLDAVQAMQQQFGVDDLLAAWHRGDIPQRGSLDDSHEAQFHFHGVGLTFESVHGEADFDFGPNGRCDGFDGWRLWRFATSHADQYPDFQREAVVESVLGELVTDGIVVRPRWMPSPHLCYLKQDLRPDDRIGVVER